MSSFDEIIISCPDCSKTKIVQSKGGNCLGEIYTLDNAPFNILSDVNRHAPFKCDVCGCIYIIHLKALAIERRIINAK